MGVSIILNDRQVVGMDVVQIKADKGDKSGWFTLEVSAG
jgi:hypothetical protein